jgi:hypothetical protein
MTDTGRANPVKTKLISLIKSADPSLTDIVISGTTTSHVIPEWKQSIAEIRVFPHITVRIPNLDTDDVFLGRVRTSGSENESSEVQMEFTAHVLCSNCTVSGEAKGKYALELADKIISYLKKNKSDSATGIYDITNLKARESDVGPFNMSRVIVEGIIWCKRPDD